MRALRSCDTLFLLAVLIVPGAAPIHGQSSSDTVTVKSGGLRQSFAGFGASQASRLTRLAPRQRETSSPPACPSPSPSRGLRAHGRAG